jgi:hypothetical protein
VYDAADVDEGVQPDSGQDQLKGLFADLYLPQLQLLDAEELQWSQNDMCPHTPLCGSEGLNDVTTAAPALRCLCIKGSLAWGRGSNTDLQSMSSLACLTRLEMTAGQQLQDWHMQSLAKVPALSSLAIAEVGSFITNRGILGLSTLSALSNLELTGVSSHSVSLRQFTNREFTLHNKLGQVGPGPDPARHILLIQRSGRLGSHGS